MPDDIPLREQAQKAILFRGLGVRAEQAKVSPEPRDGELRRALRARLAKRELFATSGIATVRLGTGRPCNVCEQPIEAATMERQVDGPGIFGLAHPDCYLLWREESALLGDPPV